MRGYKIVREDWTDCRGSTVRYAVGETAAVKSPDGPDHLCGCGLHACYRPEDTLRYRDGRWPLHLLHVEGVPIAQGADKFRCGSLTVLAELPLHRAFGPNGANAILLLDDLKTFPWFAPPALVRPAVEMHVAAHLQRLSRYGSAATAPVRFETDLAAASAAA